MKFKLHFHSFVLVSGALLAPPLTAPAQIVTIARSSAAIEGEPSRPIIYVINRTGGTANGLTVFYTVSGQPDSQFNYPAATPGVDYQAFSGTAVIPAGQASVTISMPTIQDSEFENTESIVLTLTAPANGTYTVGSPSTATQIILDQGDLPTLTVVATAPNASESGPTPGTLTISRTGYNGNPLVMDYRLVGVANVGVDYTISPANLSFPAGASSIAVTLTPVDDSSVEGAETATFILQDTATVNVGASDRATITIADNEAGAPSPSTEVWPAAFEPFRLLTLNLQLNANDWTQLVNNEPGPAYSGSMQADGENTITVGIRKKISNERYDPVTGIRKVGLKIDVNEYFPSQSWRGLQKLSLETGGEAGVVKEGLGWLLHRLASDAGIYGYPSAYAAWIKVYVNGVYQGLYLNAEQRDDEMVKNRKLYRANSTWLYKFADVLITAPPSPASPTYQHICYAPFGTGCSAPPLAEQLRDLPQWIDMQGWLTLGAVNTFMWNPDGPFVTPGHNVYRIDFYPGREKPSLYVPWDLDEQRFRMADQTQSIYTGMDDPYFKQRYQDIMKSLLDGPFAPNVILSVLDQLQVLLTSALESDPNRNLFDQNALYPPPAQTVSQHFDQIREWWQKRFDNVRSQLPTPLTPATLTVNGSQFSILHNNPNGIAYYTTDGSDPWTYDNQLSPSAQAYSGPVTLPGTRHVITRVQVSGSWSPATRRTINVSGHAAALRISEIMYHPASPSTAELAAGFNDPDDFEFVELKNTGASEIDLSRCSLGGIAYTFPPGARFQPSQLLVLVRNPVAFELRYPGSPYHGVYRDGMLDNGGETLSVRDSDGQVLTSVVYDDDSPWPTTPDGTGPSLVLINPSMPGSASSWRASLSARGSPGLDEFWLSDAAATANTFSMTIHGFPGWQTTVEWAGQLPASSWATLETITLPASGVISRMYAIPSSQKSGFYRARSGSFRSTNAMGYLIAMGPGPFRMISNPFNRSGNALNTVLPLPASAVGSRLHRFNPITQSYTIATFVNLNNTLGWSASTSDPTFPPGVGGFFESKVDGAPGPVNLIFAGEVPQGNFSVSIPGNSLTAMLASPVPWTASAGFPGASGVTLGFPAINNDRILQFDDLAQAYVSSTFVGSINRWSGSTANGPVIPAGTSFWIQRSGAPGIWTQSYSIWP